MPKKLEGRTVVGLKLKRNRRLLNPGTLDSLTAFADVFKAAAGIDWCEVGKTHDGIICIPYFKEQILQLKTKRNWSWYLTLDAETVMIWNKTAVRAFAIL